MYHKTSLDNGVRVLTEPVPGARSVCIGVLVDAGPQDESEVNSGLAHVVEHALFHGTSGRDALAISRFIDEAGGQLGAFTARDYTCYFANVLNDYSPYAMDLLGDVLVNSVFPSESLEREKGTILREMDMMWDTPDEFLHDQLKSKIWPDRLGRSILGSPAHLQQITRDDVIDFVRHHYTADRVIVAAAGAVDHAHFVSQTQDALWRLQPGEPRTAPERVKYRAAISLHRRDLAQTYFLLGIPTIPYAAPERYSLHLLACVLGGGMSSRLFRVLREREGLVHHIHAENHAYRSGGLLTIEGCTSADCFPLALEATLDEIDRLARGQSPIHEEELWKGKMQIRGQQQLAGDSMHTRMSRLATQELYFGNPIDEDEIVAEIERVTIADLQRLASDVLRPAMQQVSLAATGPQLQASEWRPGEEDWRSGLLPHIQSLCADPVC